MKLTILSFPPENNHLYNDEPIPDYRFRKRLLEYPTENNAYMRDQDSQRNNDVTQDAHNHNNRLNVLSEELGLQKPRCAPNPMEPNQDDVDTIAKQMRTMPNYFAAMAAAASQNIRKGVNPTSHQSNVSSTVSFPPNNDLGYSSYPYHQQSTPQFHPKYSTEIYDSGNNDWSVRASTSSNAPEEATGRLRSIEENTTLQNAVSK